MTRPARRIIAKDPRIIKKEIVLPPLIWRMIALVTTLTPSDRRAVNRSSRSQRQAGAMIREDQTAQGERLSCKARIAADPFVSRIGVFVSDRFILRIDKETGVISHVASNPGGLRSDEFFAALSNFATVNQLVDELFLDIDNTRYYGETTVNFCRRLCNEATIIVPSPDSGIRRYDQCARLYDLLTGNKRTLTILNVSPDEGAQMRISP